jgi:cell division protein FtsB
VVAALEAEMARLGAQNAALQAEVAELRAFKARVLAAVRV